MIDLNDYDLILFDIDETIVLDYNSTEPLPGRQAFFDKFIPLARKFAFVTNQGGVGLRYWMEKEGWGEPEKYPSQEQVALRLQMIFKALGLISADLRPIKSNLLYCCFAYRNKEGVWGPTPYDDSFFEGYSIPPLWDKNRRKPSPHMIWDAARDHFIESDNYKRILMVGDRSEDHLAAIHAGVKFAYADIFFEGTK